MEKRNQVKSFSISRLLTGASCQFHSTTLALVKEVTPAKLHIEDLLPLYETSVDKYLSAINKSRRLANTKEITDADKARDYNTRILFKIVKSLQRDPVDNHTGNLLWTIISPYEGIWDNEINKQTSQIKGLLRDIKAGISEEILKEVGLSKYILATENYNGEVEFQMDIRIKNEAIKENINTKKQAHIVDNLYLEIIQKINAFAIAVPSEDINEFILNQNANIDEYKRVISGMRPGGTGNEKGKGKKEEQETEE